LGWHSLSIAALNKVDAEFHSCERVISKLESSNWQVCLDYRRDARRAANVAWLPVFLVAIDPFLLRRAMLPERRTGATLGDMQLRSHLLDAGTATRGA